MDGILFGFRFASRKTKTSPAKSEQQTDKPKSNNQETNLVATRGALSVPTDASPNTSQRSSDMRLTKNTSSSKPVDEDFDIPSDPVVPSYPGPTNALSMNSSSAVAQSKTPSAVIGAKITFKGELTGEEDLLIQGRVEGTIDLKGNHLTVGTQGIVKANMMAKTITIEGTVEGDVVGQERIEIKASSNVKGNLVAARVTLEDGAKFRGSIDMDSANGAGKSGFSSSSSSSASASIPPNKTTNEERTEKPKV